MENQSSHRPRSIDEGILAFKEAGLDSLTLILGIDFTESNKWTGKHSFNNRSLHTVGDTLNPYEKAISIIGKILAPFAENLLPCFGFGDAITYDKEVFSFHTDRSRCRGYEEAMACYKNIVPLVQLGGPTSYAPVVDTARDIVKESGGQYHVLVIMTDGPVTRSVDTSDGELSPQEVKTINSIVKASKHPFSIILVGVGDGPWDYLKRFEEKMSARKFDNFQFVNFTEIMSKEASPSENETVFATSVLRQILLHYEAAKKAGLLGLDQRRVRCNPRPPPGPPRLPSNNSAAMRDDQNKVCPVCFTNGRETAFGCGHLTCGKCSPRLSVCPICREPIRIRLRIYI